ncbi:carbohydrate ABC transporter permease [Planotetraspora mira]|uniref:Sugar ABC transporter permease n=1 Tax=Planotetraspora mira TaxID=58121 RepID=A0A8J3X9L9_9ACTN|nr:carbohydrate ABC transporter permease [Planotetraspora mira]GII32975.1 sugar ABC transporter permease [Planotetraspora mira]
MSVSTSHAGGFGLLGRRRRDRMIMQLFLGVTAVVWLFPVWSALSEAFRLGGPSTFVSLFTDPLGGVPIWRTYLNSLANGVVHTAVVLVVSLPAGYAFGKLQFPGRELLYYGTLLFLAIPGTAILVPLYHVTHELGLFNTYLGVGLPEAALTVPFGVLLMRNYADNVPDQLLEAAIVDRAGHPQIFRYVFVPMARPAIVNLTVLCFMWSLQDFLWPAIFNTRPEMTTAAQAVSTFHNALSASPVDAARYSASLVLLALPAVLLVVFGLRFITSGLTSGALKD